MRYDSISLDLLQVLDEDNCQQKSRVVGGHLLESLARLRDEFEVVGDVRGKGLMLGIELVRSKVCAILLSYSLLLLLLLYYFFYLPLVFHSKGLEIM